MDKTKEQMAVDQIVEARRRLYAARNWPELCQAKKDLKHWETNLEYILAGK